jgi:hypothetical protein
MHGNVFECYEEQNDRRQFTKTLAALEGYVKKKLKLSEDLAPMFAPDMSDPVIDKPSDLDANPTETDKLIWQEEIKEYVQRAYAYSGAT